MPNKTDGDPNKKSGRAEDRSAQRAASRRPASIREDGTARQMWRLNRNARQNLYVGQTVQTDMRDRPDDLYEVTDLYDLAAASDGYAIKVRPVAGSASTCEACGSILHGAEQPPTLTDSYVTAACWFWPVGVLEFVKENAGRGRKFDEREDARRRAL